MISFCYFCQEKTFSIVSDAHNYPLFAQIGTKKQLLRGFTNCFFINAGLKHKLLILVESPNIIFWKTAKKCKFIVVFGKIWAKLGPMSRKNKEAGI